MSGAKQVLDLRNGLDVLVIEDPLPGPRGVNSIGKLREWIASLSVQQTDINVFADDLEEFALGVLFETEDASAKNKAWEALIQFVAQTIYARTRVASEIVWRIRPEFDVVEHRPFERVDPNGPDYDPITDQRGWRKPPGEALIKAYFRCAFRCVGNQT